MFVYYFYSTPWQFHCQVVSVSGTKTKKRSGTDLSIGVNNQVHSTARQGLKPLSQSASPLKED